jgi:hypothetical protein
MKSCIQRCLLLSEVVLLPWYRSIVSISLNISSLLFCLICFVGQSQETFNKRYTFYEGGSGFFNSIIETSDGYLASALCGGGISFVQIDHQGNVLNEIYYPNDTALFHLHEDNLQWVNDSTLLHVGRVLNQQNEQHQFLVWLNAQGDTLSTSYHKSYYFDEEPVDQYDQVSWYYPLRIMQDESGNIYESAVLRLAGSHLRKFDAEGNLLWQILFDEENDHDAVRIYSMAMNNGNIVLPIYFYKGFGTFETYSYLYTVSPEGEILEETLIPEVNREIKDIIRTEGGDFILASADYFQGSFPWIVKIDSQGELLWQISFDEDNYGVEQWFSTIDRTQDGHYVVAGQIYDTTPENEEVDGLYNYYGQIVKFTEEGEILWDRRYDGISSIGDSHFANDLKPTSDGGYIFCGQSKDGFSNGPNYEAPSQRGWIVKLDEFGCLVPGCQNVGVDEIEIDAFIMGPNPAVDHLNIYVGQLHEASKIIITDIGGREVKSFHIRNAATTYMLDIDELASGTYVVSLLEQNEILHSEVLVVE